MIDRAAIEALGVVIHEAQSHTACHWCPTEQNTSYTCRKSAVYTFTKSRPATVASACEAHALSVAHVVAGKPRQAAVELRLGTYQTALADVGSCDTCMFDAPYSEKTHGGHDDAIEGNDGADRRDINYWFWSEREVNEAVDLWAPKTLGWFVTITDHVLAPLFTAALERHGRYVFPPLPLVEVGSRVRMQGDGPSSWTCQVVVARPRNIEYARWGTLRGAYVGPRETKPVIGGKPLWAMKQLVEDYSRPGDLIVDLCAGGATTLLAAKLLGRRAIGSELDPKTHALAVERLNGTPSRKSGQSNIFSLLEGA